MKRKLLILVILLLAAIVGPIAVKHYRYQSLLRDMRRLALTSGDNSNASNVLVILTERFHEAGRSDEALLFAKAIPDPHQRAVSVSFAQRPYTDTKAAELERLREQTFERVGAGKILDGISGYLEEQDSLGEDVAAGIAKRFSSQPIPDSLSSPGTNMHTMDFPLIDALIEIAERLHALGAHKHAAVLVRVAAEQLGRDVFDWQQFQSTFGRLEPLMSSSLSPEERRHYLRNIVSTLLSNAGTKYRGACLELGSVLAAMVRADDTEFALNTATGLWTYDMSKPLVIAERSGFFGEDSFTEDYLRYECRNSGLLEIEKSLVELGDMDLAFRALNQIDTHFGSGYSEVSDDVQGLAVIASSYARAGDYQGAGHILAYFERELAAHRPLRDKDHLLMSVAMGWLNKTAAR